VITVGANIEAGASLGNVSQEVNRQIADVRMPPRYRLTQGGEVESQQEVFGNIFTALGIAVLLMYLILVVQFGSFLDPLAILVSLPLSLIGVVLALLITGDSLNIMSLIGVILLMGIVAKNAILLIDFAKWGTERGMGRHEGAGGSRPHPSPSHSHDHAGAHCRHDPGRVRSRRGGGLPRAARPSRHWRGDHVHVDVVRDPHRVRHSRGLA
jgi:hypothetical protein